MPDTVKPRRESFAGIILNCRLVDAAIAMKLCRCPSPPAEQLKLRQVQLKMRQVVKTLEAESAAP